MECYGIVKSVRLGAWAVDLNRRIFIKYLIVREKLMFSWGSIVYFFWNWMSKLTWGCVIEGMPLNVAHTACSLMFIKLMLLWWVLAVTTFIKYWLALSMIQKYIARKLDKHWRRVQNVSSKCISCIIRNRPVNIVIIIYIRLFHSVNITKHTRNCNFSSLAAILE